MFNIITIYDNSYVLFAAINCYSLQATKLLLILVLC